MTNQNNAAQPMLTDDEIFAALRPLYADAVAAQMGAGDDLSTARAIESALLSKLRAPVADELQPSGNAGELPDAVRVPLDSLHADAGYLVGRALDHSLSRAEVVAVIRSRIDAAKAALASAPVAGEAKKPVGTLLNQHGEILWHRKPDYFPADFYAAPQASNTEKQK